MGQHRGQKNWLDQYHSKVLLRWRAAYFCPADWLYMQTNSPPHPCLRENSTILDYQHQAESYRIRKFVLCNQKYYTVDFLQARLLCPCTDLHMLLRTTMMANLNRRQMQQYKR